MARPFRKKAPETPVRIEIKKNDIVKVIAGRDKGKQGRVLSVDRERGKLLVEHVMMIKRHTRKSQANPQGKIIEREGSIHLSNVMKAEAFDARAAKRAAAPATPAPTP